VNAGIESDDVVVGNFANPAGWGAIVHAYASAVVAGEPAHVAAVASVRRASSEYAEVTKLFPDATTSVGDAVAFLMTCCCAVLLFPSQFVTVRVKMYVPTGSGWSTLPV